MKLEEYVQKTFLDITNGVAAAQGEAQLYIAPGFVENERLTSPPFVKFEVGLTVSKEAGGGIRVLALGEGKAGISSEQVNRISFEVPVYFQAPTPRNPNHHSHRETEDS